jgi:hypothetical protein
MNKKGVIIRKLSYSLLVLLVGFFLCNAELRGQSTGEYRTRGSGNWNGTTVWEQYTGIAWVPVSTFPQSFHATPITILVGDSICVPNGLVFQQGNKVEVDGILHVNGRWHTLQHKIEGVGTFRVQGSTALLGIGDSLGIQTVGNVGSVQTLTRRFDKNASYQYEGIGRQITGNALPDTLRHLFLNNTDSFTALSGVRLSRHTYILDTFHFIKGKMFTDSQTAILTFAPAASAKGFGPQSYFSGPVRFSWTANSLTHKMVPVGKDTLYRPISVRYNHNNSNLNMYQYEFMIPGPHYTTIANSANYSFISHKSYWRCGRIVGSSTINNSELGFSWSLYDGIVDYQSIVIGKGDDQRTEWRRIIGTPTIVGNNTAGMVYVADNNPSTALDYILASTSVNFLPVTLASIGYACASSEELDVYWKTVREEDVLSFKINLYDYESALLDWKEELAKGSPYIGAEYWVRMQSYNSMSHLSLLELNYNGQEAVITQMKLKQSCQDLMAKWYWLSEWNEPGFVCFSFMGLLVANSVEVEVLDANGKVIETVNPLLNDLNMWKYNDKNLSTGVYYFRFQFHGKQQVIKVVV